MDLHWLHVSETIKFKTLLYVYKSLNGLCPKTWMIVWWLTDPALAQLPPALVTAWTSWFLRLRGALGTEPFQWLLHNCGINFPLIFVMLLMKILSRLLSRLICSKFLILVNVTFCFRIVLCNLWKRCSINAGCYVMFSASWCSKFCWSFCSLFFQLLPGAC